MPRPKGSRNRVSAHVKDGLVRAFEDLGGQEGLVRWAKQDPQNLRDLYSWWARMAPKEVIADVEVEGEFTLSWDK